MAHLIEPSHSERFVALLNRHYPGWREARAELNELPFLDKNVAASRERDLRVGTLYAGEH
jgi:hypothetical protein